MEYEGTLFVVFPDPVMGHLVETWGLKAPRIWIFKRVQVPLSS